MKIITVTFTNGEVYNIPTYEIAHQRATYYANHDEGEQPKDKSPSDEWSKVYENELKYTLEDDLEIYDWARNNMNWSDFEEDAVRIFPDKKKFDYEKDWLDGAELDVKVDILTWN